MVTAEAGERLVASIEDDPAVAECLGQCVESAGWIWCRLPGGPGMVEAPRSIRPSVVTTGSRHPSLPGIELLGIMQREVDLANTPVVFVTPMARESLWNAIRAAGLDPDSTVAGYACKPFDREELVAEIRRVLRAESPSAHDPGD